MHRLRQWKFYGSAVFEVSQTYSAELPPQCWLLVNWEGVHLSEIFSKTPLVSHKYNQITSASPDMDSIMIVVGDRAHGIKYVFQTQQVRPFECFIFLNMISYFQLGTRNS